MLLVFQVLEFRRERGKSFCSSVRANLPPSPPSHPGLPDRGFCAVPPPLSLFPALLLSIIHLTPWNSLSGASCPSGHARQLPKGQGLLGGSAAGRGGGSARARKVSQHMSHTAGSLLPALLESSASPPHRTGDAFKLEGAFSHQVILILLVREEKDLQY